jgi:outer membrane receptor for ferrienterochelin and colicins
MKKIISYLPLIFFEIFSSAVLAQAPDTLKTEDILSMSLQDLMNVQVITVSKTMQSVKDVPASVHVITAEQIKDRGYLTLEETLSDLPGFQFRNILGFNSYIFMRGVPSQNNMILLMVDGIQINELNSGGFYAGGQFILSNMERIEVVYGPASALYGTNAVSGIINIITKKSSGKTANINLSGGNFKTGILNFNMSNYDSVKNTGYSLSGQYKTTGKADLKGAAGDNNWSDNMENFENDLSFNTRVKIKNINVGIDYQEKRSSMTTNFKSVNDISLDKNTLWDIMFLNAFVKYINNLNRNWTLNSTAYYRNSTVKPNTIDQIIKSTDSTSGEQIGYFRPNHLFGFENQFNYKPSQKLLVIGGLIGETEALSNGYSITYSNSQEMTPPAPAKPPMLNNYLFSYYLQIQYKILKQLSLNAGMREDFSNYYGHVLIPRLGLVFNHEKITAKALYNKAFRSPKPWDYKYGTGNSSLKPEKMKSIELDLSYSTQNIFTAGASVYYNVINNKLTEEKTDLVDRWINKNKLLTTGFELYGNLISGIFNFYSNYSYNNSRDQDDIFIPEISKHTANAGFSCSFLKTFKTNLRANYLGNRKNPSIIPSTGNDKINDALIFNGCISYSGLKKFNLQLKMNNILNDKYYDPSNRFKGRYRQPQRTILLGVTYNFESEK